MGTHLGGGLLWPAGSRNLDRAKARMCKARRVLPSTRAVLVGATPTLSRSDSSSGGGAYPISIWSWCGLEAANERHLWDSKLWHGFPLGKNK
jgi:hypothetical protein